MKKPFVFLVFVVIGLFSYIYRQTTLPSIVCIHIGKEIPSHVGAAIAQIRTFNPKLPIYLLANESAINESEIELPEGVSKIALESIKKSSIHRSFLEQVYEGSEAEGSYWQKVVQRFYYLSDFMLQYRLKHVFHIENDVLVFCNFQDISRTLQLKKVKLATILQEEKAYPNIVYVRSGKYLSPILSIAKSHCKKGAHDGDLFTEGWNRRHQIGLTQITSEFGIFDTGIFGNTLTGAPKKLSRFSLPPSTKKITWNIDKSGKIVPFYNDTQLLSLHIQTKQLGDFTEVRLLKQRDLGRRGVEVVSPEFDEIEQGKRNSFGSDSQESS